MKKRIIPLLLTAIALTICTAIVTTTNMGIPTFNIIGAYCSLIAITILTYKMPIGIYNFSMFFIFIASALGTVLDLYRSIEIYDKLLHYVSGILMAMIGAYLMECLYKKCRVENLQKVLLPTILFAMFFSFSCAAFWEVYEFTADQLVHTKMQGVNLNTMGDIISGILGGLTYGIFVLGKNRKKLIP